MSYKIVSVCRSCGFEELVDLLSLGNQKIVDFRNKPVSIPLELVQCSRCSLVQLRHTTKPELLWNDGYGYRSGVNAAMVQHLHDIAKAAEAYVDDGDAVLDIACNDGTLLEGYTKNVMRTGIDPSRNVAKHAMETLKGLPHKIVYDFFNKEVLNSKFQVITCISMFYDLDEPGKFLEDVKACLEKNGVFIIQQNYLGSMIKNCAFDNICHEHLEYYSLTSLQILLKKHGLTTFRVEENELNGGSIRTFICRIGERPIDKNVEEMIKREVQLDLSSFASKVKEVTNSIKQMVDDIRAQGKTIYAYGASTRGGTLLQTCGIDNSHISYAVERNPDKYGKNMECVAIPIISEEEARKAKPDYMIILPWFFAEHFIEREKDYLAGGGHFIIPLPTPRIV